MRTHRLLKTLSGIGLALALVGCSTKSPSEPSQTPSNPVPPTPIVSTTVSVTASPSSLPLDSTTPATVTVRVTRSDGAVPANGSQVTLTTTLGGFGSISGGASTTLDLVNGQATAFLFPGGTAGIATLRAVFGTVAGSGTVEFRSAAEFFVSSVEPNQGSADGGTNVTINGGGFKDPVRVTFDGIPGVVQSVSSSRIVVTTPRTTAPTSELPKAVTVAVTIRANQTDARTDTLASGFIYTAGGTISQPRILSITPTSGTNDGGTRITINGDGFETPLQVLFTGPSSGGQGDISLEASLISTSRTQLVVLSPPASGFGAGFTNQNVTITVKNLTSGLQADATQKYHYGTKVQITSMGPGSGPFTGGTHVTIFGSGFSGPVAVSLGGVGQPVLNVTGSEIIFQTAPIAVTTCPGNGIVAVSGVRVVNIDTGDSADAALGFNYVIPVPLIFGISPNSGATGAAATITGQNFATNLQVLFGGANGSAATIGAHTSTSISITVPPTPPGFVFNTEACDGNGDGIAGGTRPIPTPASITVINLDGTGCSGTLSNAFTLTPSNNACSGDTSTPPPPVASFTFVKTGGLNVQFTSTSTGSISSYTWDFGDSTTSSQQNPAHAYAVGGTYSVTLTVANSGGSNTSAPQSVTVP